MTRVWMVAALLLCACAAPVLAQGEHAMQWPLQTGAAGAGAYRVLLDAGVYRQARAADLGDVDVVNADGVPVPVQLLGAEAVTVAGARRVPLRWFVLPAVATRQGAGDMSVLVERDAEGRVLRLAASVPAQQDDPLAPDAWLVDASPLHGPVVALHLQWTPGAALDRAYAVEASDDLRHWRTLPVQARLLDLARGGERLRQRRVPVETEAKYLRLRPADGVGGVQLQSLEAELAPPQSGPLLAWELLRTDAAAISADGEASYRYTLTGRFPVQGVDVEFEGNGTGEWRLYSRDADDAPWRLRAGPWVAYRIGEGAAADRSAAQALEARVRDREWKLVGGGAPLHAPPQLRLGWRADALVFVAQGPGPYRLVAGSARAVRKDAPVAQSLAAIRAARGGQWQPALATLGPMQPLAGDRALQPAAPARDWRGWLRWTLLVAAALVVAGFALSLLRAPRGDPDANA